MSNQSDLSIVQSVLAGEVNAYASLVNRYKDMAVSLAYNILLNREDAEEVAQDAFLKAYRSLSFFKGSSKFSTWFYRIVVNTALNKKRLTKHYSAELTDSADIPAESNHGLSAQSAGEQKKYIQLAMQSLTDNERICISLYYLNELCVEEVSESTGITVANIKVLLYRARKKLHKRFPSYIRDELKT